MYFNPPSPARKLIFPLPLNHRRQFYYLVRLRPPFSNLRILQLFRPSMDHLCGKILSILSRTHKSFWCKMISFCFLRRNYGASESEGRTRIFLFLCLETRMENWLKICLNVRLSIILYSYSAFFLMLVFCLFLILKWKVGFPGSPGAVVVRAEEALIVVFVLVLWVAAIALFFNRWGKIRMLEPYQPKFQQQQRTSCAVAETTSLPVSLIFILYHKSSRLSRIVFFPRLFILRSLLAILKIDVNYFFSQFWQQIENKREIPFVYDSILFQSRAEAANLVQQRISFPAKRWLFQTYCNNDRMNLPKSAIICPLNTNSFVFSLLYTHVYKSLRNPM